MFEKESKEYANKWLYHVKDLELQHKEDDKPEYIRILEAHREGAEFSYNKAKEEHKGKCKTAYIKGIRTMANALKDYDRTDGAWTDYFEHKVDEVLKRLLKEIER